MASLRPVTLAISLDERAMHAFSSGAPTTLEFYDCDARQMVGSLRLRPTAEPAGTRHGFVLAEVFGDHQRCLSWPLSWWTRMLQTRAMRAGVKPGNFVMSPPAIHQTMVFYMCPRPVVAVSVQSGDHRNMFPMDLIGPLAADRFMLALRTTSPSIGAMMTSRRVALSDFRAADVQVAYALGAHHKRSIEQWENLPFATKPSPLFGLPTPGDALRVREVEIDGSDVIGSHRLFSGRIVSEDVRGPGAQLCHVPGIYEYFRRRIGRPITPASP
jgi:flavin reductase (DIM6/NTAB) family NADH-FMN oxidoreductase RutF